MFSLMAKKDYNIIFIERTDPIFRDDILIAFMKVESGMDHKIVNRLGYSGILQIGKEMIKEANRISQIRGFKDRFTLSDRFNKERSIKIWYLVQIHHKGITIKDGRIEYDIEKAWRIWNPLSDKRYIERIKNEINK